MLGALKSLYSNSTLQVTVEGRVGQPYDSYAELKKGWPMSPTFLGLFGDKLHEYIKSHRPAQGLLLEAMSKCPFQAMLMLLADSPVGLQHLVDAAVASCDAVDVIIGAVKTQTMVFSAHPVPASPWHCQGVPMQQVEKFKYPAVHLWHAATFRGLNRKMTTAWAHLRQWYGNLAWASSVGLLFRLYKACVPPTAFYGCEAWGFHSFDAYARAQHAALAQPHWQTFKRILDVSSTIVAFPSSQRSLTAELACLPLRAM